MRLYSRPGCLGWAAQFAQEKTRRFSWAEGCWTDKGVREVKWPKDFTKEERKLIRAIAKVALESGKK
jgi:hypothetical protein